MYGTTAMPRRRVRIEQSRQELNRLDEEFRSWHRRQSESDVNGQYATQLEALAEVVTTTLRHIATELDALPTTIRTRDVHERCRRADHQAVFVRRLWSYYREKWAQRDDPELKALLAAADEVVWSCYAPPFRDIGVDPPAAPLPFVDDEHSPYAVPSPHPPADLRPSDELLRRTLSELPMPVIAVPPVCVARPWWLMMLAHEVGHQISYSFEGRPAAAAAGALADAVGGTPCGQLWKGWADELFADAYATALVGGAHHWALVELEQGSDETMTRLTSDHPPPIVRHAVAAAVLGEIGLTVDQALPSVISATQPDELDMDAGRRECIDELLAMAPTVAAALVNAPLVDGWSLANAPAVDHTLLGRGGKAGWWSAQLGGPRVRITGEESLHAARLVTVGAVGEWERIADDPDAERRAARAARLCERMLAVAAASREPGTRAWARGPATDVTEFAVRVAQSVVALPVDESGGDRTQAQRRS
jgi:hypothetical protein